MIFGPRDGRAIRERHRHDVGPLACHSGVHDGVESVAGPDAIARSNGLDCPWATIRFDHRSGHETRVVVEFHGLILAPVGGLRVPHVAGGFADEGGASVGDAEFPGGEEGGDASDAW